MGVQDESPQVHGVGEVLKLVVGEPRSWGYPNWHLEGAKATWGSAQNRETPKNGAYSFEFFFYSYHTKRSQFGDTPMVGAVGWASTESQEDQVDEQGHCTGRVGRAQRELQQAQPFEAPWWKSGSERVVLAHGQQEPQGLYSGHADPMEAFGWLGGWLPSLGFRTHRMARGDPI